MTAALFQNGIEYERRAAARLRRAGYRVQWNENHPPHDPDLIIKPDITVEVKGSCRRKVGGHSEGFCFTLFRQGFSAPIVEDFVLLLCAGTRPREDVAFVLTRNAARSVHHITIPNREPSAYAGLWSLYFQAFALIDEHGPERRTR